ncbi:MAG: beta strand repeat-containing protein, partial [Jatrophihabitans sp.]|uniref:beta strand repeat-containing protein n=1 Tax=Jatrophihabitans sp. TaxID=1932789 RepID=UPI003F801584
MRNPARSLRPKTALVAAVTLAITGVALLDANPAAAATVLTVTNPADVATNFGGCGNSSITTGSGLSLREAVCIANNNGTTPVIIDVAAGHYTLTNGELQAGKVSGSNISIVGAGAGSAVIDGNGASRVFDLDPLAGGGVTTSISNVTITNGVDNTVGGAGILAGSAGLLPVDSLTLTGVVVSNNQAGGSAPTNPNLPGAGVSFQGGNLTVSGSTFSGNNSHSSIGSGLFYQSFTAGEHLTVTGSTFSGNQIAANTSSAYQSGGALATISSGTDIVSVSSSTFTNNTATATGSATAVGGGIYAQGGALTVTGSTFTGNTASASGGAIYTQATSSTLHYNRIVGNNAAAASGVGSTVSAGSNNATENWWGCNAGPGSTGCDGASSVTTAPQLSLSTSASPSHVNAASGTSTLTASLLTDSAAGSVSSSNLGAFAGLPVSFADPPGDATVTSTPGAHSVNLSAGTASIDYHANTTLGPDNTTATFDNQSTTVILEVDAAPAITSADHAGFTFGTFDSFTVTTTGYPAAGLSESGALPSGVTFHDN